MGVTLDGVESSFRSKGEEREGERERAQNHIKDSHLSILEPRNLDCRLNLRAISLILSHPVTAKLIYIATRELINLDWPIRIEGSYQKLFAW